MENVAVNQNYWLKKSVGLATALLADLKNEILNRFFGSPIRDRKFALLAASKFIEENAVLSSTSMN